MIDYKKWIIILLLVCIFSLNIFVTFKVIKHYEVFSNDPLVYGAKSYDIDYCSCFTNDGKQITFNQSAVTQKITYKGIKQSYEINISALEGMVK
jgi:hypothetical protein